MHYGKLLVLFRGQSCLQDASCDNKQGDIDGSAYANSIMETNATVDETIDQDGMENSTCSLQLEGCIFIHQCCVPMADPDDTIPTASDLLLEK